VYIIAGLIYPFNIESLQDIRNHKDQRLVHTPAYQLGMKWLCSLCIVFCSLTAEAQKVSLVERNTYVGGYYSILYDSKSVFDSIVSVDLLQQYFNFHLRSQVANRFHLGIEGILAIVTSSARVHNPFYLFGMHGEYMLINGDKAYLFLRLGFSSGNLSYAGDGIPERRFIFNLTAGGNLGYRISARTSIEAGYYNHTPLNRIPESYSAAMPFIGLHYKI
jgi:hypothetical protein